MKSKQMFLVTQTGAGFWLNELSDFGREKLEESDYKPDIDLWSEWEQHDSVESILEKLKEELIG